MNTLPLIDQPTLSPKMTILLTEFYHLVGTSMAPFGVHDDVHIDVHPKKKNRFIVKYPGEMSPKRFMKNLLDVWLFNVCGYHPEFRVTGLHNGIPGELQVNTFALRKHYKMYCRLFVASFKYNDVENYCRLKVYTEDTGEGTIKIIYRFGKTRMADYLELQIVNE